MEKSQNIANDLNKKLEIPINLHDPVEINRCIGNVQQAKTIVI